MFIDVPPPSDSQETLKAAWAGAFRPEIQSYMATIIGKQQVPLIGRIRVYYGARPDLYIDTNPYVSFAHLREALKLNSDPGRLFREHNNSFLAFLNLAQLRLPPHDDTGVDNSQIILELLGIKTTGSTDYRNDTPFSVGFINGPKRHHSAGRISIALYSSMLMDYTVRDQSPDTVIRFTDELNRLLGLNIQPLDRSTFLRQAPALLQPPE